MASHPPHNPSERVPIRGFRRFSSAPNPSRLVKNLRAAPCSLDKKDGVTDLTSRELQTSPLKRIRSTLSAVATDHPTSTTSSFNLNVDGTYINDGWKETSVLSPETSEMKEYCEDENGSAEGQDVANDSGAPDTSVERRATDEYYIERLQEVLHTEGYLFNDEEHVQLALFLSITGQARRLCLTLLGRKPGWHRWDKVAFGRRAAFVEEKGSALDGTLLEFAADIPRYTSVAREELVTVGFADVDEPEEINEALSLLTKDEIRMLGKIFTPHTRSTLGKKVRKPGSTSPFALLVNLHLQKTVVAEGIKENVGKQQTLRFNQGKLTLSKSTTRLFEQVNTLTRGRIRLRTELRDLLLRVEHIYYRTSEWTSNPAMTRIIVSMGYTNFPQYRFARTAVFSSREDLILYLHALKDSHDMQRWLQDGKKGMELHEDSLLTVIDRCLPLWRTCVAGQGAHPSGIYFMNRYMPGWILTTIVEGACTFYASQKRLDEELVLLNELLTQTMFRLRKRGSWFERKALIQESHAMMPLMQRRTLARETCLKAINDKYVQTGPLQAIMKRLQRLEGRLQIPEDEQTLKKQSEQMPTERIFFGRRTRSQGTEKKGLSTRSVWVGETGEVSVEMFALEQYELLGYRGFHSENSIFTTLVRHQTFIFDKRSSFLVCPFVLGYFV